MFNGTENASDLAVIQMPATAAEPVGEGSTDDQLIAAARRYARAVDRNVRAILDRHRRVIEDFFRLGEALNYLYKRRSMGDWGRTLKEIGVSVATDSYARRFANSTTFEGLDRWETKTQALRELGILKPKPAPGSQATAGIPAVAPEGADSDQPVETAPRLAVEVRTPSPQPSGTSRPDALIKPQGAVGTPPTPPSDPAPYELLARVVRTLEEVGQVDEDALHLLDRAAELIRGLREAAVRRDVS